MKTKLSFFFSLIFVLTYTVSNAEEIKKVKYGKVSLEELQMTKYDQDTSAEAVVLYQYEEFVPLLYKYIKHIRIKVLKPTAKDIGSMVFRGKLKLYIDACTYNLEGDKIVKSKLKSESIFEEKVFSGFYNTRIAMPNVKVGSVFEIYISQEEAIPFEIRIQQGIPVQYCAIKFPKDPDIDIRLDELGTLGCTYKDENIRIYKNLPALKKEPYITSLSDYGVGIRAEVIASRYFGRWFTLQKTWADNWQDVAMYYSEHPYCGLLLKDLSIFLNGASDSIKSVSKSDEELIKNAFSVISKIKWNEQEFCFISQELRKTFNTKLGNSTDINLSLVILLNKMGLKSYPVLFSTRNNGKINRYLPTIQRFNFIAAAVELPSGTKYLDATNEFYPYDLSSEKLIGCWGLPLRKGLENCSVLIETSKKQKKTSYSQFSIDSIGNISGKISIKRSDYNAVDFKKNLKLYTNNDAYIRELETENSGWYINKYNFNNINDPYTDLCDEYEVNLSNTSNDMLVFNPLALIKMTANPFQDVKRTFPISFPQQTEYTSIVTISIPANYQISEIPKEINLTNNDKTVRYTYQIKKSNNSIQITSKFLITKLNFETSEYPTLKGLYENMMQKQNELIILKKV